MQYAEETYDVYDETATKARKAHTCRACGETIPPGARYVRVNVVFDGSAETIKRCARCQAIHEHLREHGDGEEWPDEALNCGDTYEDVFGRPPPDHIAALAFALPGEFPDTEADRKTAEWRERVRKHKAALRAQRKADRAE